MAMENMVSKCVGAPRFAHPTLVALISLKFKILFITLCILIGVAIMFFHKRVAGKELFNVYIGNMKLQIPKNYFHLLKPPASERPGYLLLWCLPPNMAPYSKEQSKIFYGGFQEGIIKIYIDEIRRNNYDGLLNSCKLSPPPLEGMKCFRNYEGMSVQLNLSKTYENDIDDIYVKIFSLIDGFKSRASNK